MKNQQRATARPGNLISSCFQLPRVKPCSQVLTTNCWFLTIIYVGGVFFLIKNILCLIWTILAGGWCSQVFLSVGNICSRSKDWTPKTWKPWFDGFFLLSISVTSRYWSTVASLMAQQWPALCRTKAAVYFSSWWPFLFTLSSAPTKMRYRKLLCHSFNSWISFGLTSDIIRK